MAELIQYLRSSFKDIRALRVCRRPKNCRNVRELNFQPTTNHRVNRYNIRRKYLHGRKEMEGQFPARGLTGIHAGGTGHPARRSQEFLGRGLGREFPAVVAVK